MGVVADQAYMYIYITPHSNVVVFSSQPTNSRILSSFGRAEYAR